VRDGSGIGRHVCEVKVIIILTSGSDIAVKRARKILEGPTPTTPIRQEDDGTPASAEVNRTCRVIKA
jgi:hypothetical protein